MTTDTSEKGFERLICTALTGAPCDPPQGRMVREQQGSYGAGWNGNFAAERHERPGHDGAILKYLEAANQSAHVIQGFRPCDAHWPGLRPSDDGQVLAYYLTADPQRFRVAKSAFQTCPGGIVVWRVGDTGVHQHVGIDEHGGAKPFPHRGPLA